ncbi:ribonuclease H2 subunit C-like [Mizuhopecten yessoensis]|uniref:Ribonuclease H2 subunit C n=1 Tax=Mizuhopecten yessoensis TaxID=6573 RepID=A0A210PPH2_MIZYE|nr:ribonuclease H2 subunit C-like [Mizuhopecten yessoensis]OWF38373.1 Ribonuclease H2 subunit C [Mizuhopecten yessoensis]
MATYLTVTGGLEDVKLHAVPCHIHYDGKANISQYFESNSRKSVEAMTASFRGRPLKGEVINVPHGYTGLVVKETRKAVTEDEDRHLTTINKFKEINYWNLDRTPCEDDKMKQALHWLDLAKVLHQPLEDESSQKSTVGN